MIGNNGMLKARQGKIVSVLVAGAGAGAVLSHLHDRG